ncbi:MAG: phosphotransferase [Anaerolineaceae bacterium]|nr:phosphotransferase [Anaerolineaceae bacterium]
MTIYDKNEYRSRQAQYAPLQEVGVHALQQCGIFQAELRFVSDTGNVIFQAKTAEQSYSVRVYHDPFRTNSEIVGELYWLLDLKRNSNLIVPEPLATASGELVQEITVPEAKKEVQVVIFHWLPGNIIGTTLTRETAHQIGQLMAELHDHATAFELPADSFRDTTDWRGMGHFRANLSSAQLARIEGFLSQQQLELCEKAATLAAKKIDEVSEQQDFGLIHNDLHARNCLLHIGKIAIIDFDDCQFAPFTCDMAITISSFDSLPNQKQLQEAFLQGYSEKRSLPQNYVEEIATFRAERRLRLIRWVATWPSVTHFPFGWQTINDSLQYCQQFINSVR